MLDPWERDQLGELGEGFISIDGVSLPGVLGRDIAVQYAENGNAEWPIKVTVSFYLDELKVDPKVEQFVDFSIAITAPLKPDAEAVEDAPSE